MTAITSGGTSGDLNLPKDLSILNRRGYASTTRKGVPLVYRCKIDYYLQDEDQNGISAAVGTDFASTLDVYGCQNNWVMRNAAVKWQAARENMFKKAGMPKKHRGAYAHEIRYCYDAAGDTWVTPIDGNGDAFVGGTWDLTEIVTEDDGSFALRLVGTATSEDSDVSTSVQQIGYSYLASRANLRSDTNDESDEVGHYSILEDMLAPAAIGIGDRDNIRANVEDEQDDVPYDVFAADDTNHDITEPVLLGRALASLGSGYGSVVVDIPFGLAGMKASLHDAAGTSVTSSGSICVEVLDIYEMMG
jgi:hypothetical protein